MNARRTGWFALYRQPVPVAATSPVTTAPVTTVPAPLPRTVVVQATLADDGPGDDGAGLDGARSRSWETRNGTIRVRVGGSLAVAELYAPDGLTRLAVLTCGPAPDRVCLSVARLLLIQGWDDDTNPLLDDMMQWLAR